jgi:hypothetical protein
MACRDDGRAIRGDRHEALWPLPPTYVYAREGIAAAPEAR